MFKKGDLAKCINPGDYYLTENIRYYVHDIYQPPHSNSIFLTIMDDRGQTINVFPNRFVLEEKVVKEKFPVALADVKEYIRKLYETEMDKISIDFGVTRACKNILENCFHETIKIHKYKSYSLVPIKKE